MARKTSGRFREQERPAILSDLEKGRLTRVAAAKKHGVSSERGSSYERSDTVGGAVRRANMSGCPRSALQGLRRAPPLPNRTVSYSPR